MFDFTPIVVNPGAAASSKAAKAREKQNNKSDVMHALRVVAEGYRRSSRGDPDSETPPFAKEESSCAAAVFVGAGARSVSVSLCLGHVSLGSLSHCPSVSVPVSKVDRATDTRRGVTRGNSAEAD